MEPKAHGHADAVAAQTIPDCPEGYEDVTVDLGTCSLVVRKTKNLTEDALVALADLLVHAWLEEKRAACASKDEVDPNASRPVRPL